MLLGLGLRFFGGLGFGFLRVSKLQSPLYAAIIFRDPQDAIPILPSFLGRLLPITLGLTKPRVLPSKPHLQPEAQRAAPPRIAQQTTAGHMSQRKSGSCSKEVAPPRILPPPPPHPKYQILPLYSEIPPWGIFSIRRVGGSNIRGMIESDYRVSDPNFRIRPRKTPRSSFLSSFPNPKPRQTTEEINFMRLCSQEI